MKVAGNSPETDESTAVSFGEDVPVQATQSAPELSLAGASGILSISIQTSLALTGSGPARGFLHARGAFFSLIRKSGDVRQRRLYSCQEEE